MSLDERAAGILETHVTWRDVELDMQEALGTVATFGPNKTVKNIGEGNGFMSRIALINPDWQNQGDEELPKTFIAKILSQLTMQDFSDKMKENAPFNIDSKDEAMTKLIRECHNAEVSAYELILKYAPGRVPLPKVYKYSRFSESNPLKGYILMEHMDDLVAVHMVDNIDANALRQPLRGAAIMEAISLKFTEEEKSRLNKGLYANMGKVFKPEVIGGMMDAFLRCTPAALNEKAEKMAKIIPEFMNDESFLELDKLADTLGMTRVFCHGDMWSTNMLWSRGKEGFKLRAFIDFQTAHMGCGVADLCRLLCSNMGGNDRRENYVQLLTDFYGYLREEVEGDMPYSFDQLLLAYQRVLPFTVFLIVPLVPLMIEYIKNHGSQERADVNEDQIVEKLSALMDDMFDAHEKNMAEKNSIEN